MAFWTRAALDRLAQSESGGRADLIHYPTGYTNSGVKSSASGLYGFVDGTWRQYAGPEIAAKYPRAYMAPADVQTAVAAQTPISHWTGTDAQGRPFNATAQRIAAEDGTTVSSPDPNATAGGGGDGTGGGDYGGGGTQPTQVEGTVNPGGFTDPSIPPTPNPNPGAPTVPPGSPHDPTPIQKGGGLDLIGKWFTNEGVRLGLMVLGIILIGVAALALAWGEMNKGGTVTKTAATAVKFVK